MIGFAETRSRGQASEPQGFRSMSPPNSGRGAAEKAPEIAGGPVILAAGGKKAALWKRNTVYAR